MRTILICALVAVVSACGPFPQGSVFHPDYFKPIGPGLPSHADLAHAGRISAGNSKLHCAESLSDDGDSTEIVCY